MTGAPVAEFITKTLARSSRLDDALPALRERRMAAREVLATNGLPAGKIEHWKYTPISRFYDATFTEDPPPPPEQTAAAGDAAMDGSVPLQPARGIEVRLMGAAPEMDVGNMPRGLGITRFSDANAEQHALLAGSLNQDIDTERHPLNLVNLALLEDGLLVHVSAGVHIERPIDLRMISGSRSAGCDRVLIVLERDSSLTLCEQHASHMARNQVVEIQLDDGASFNHYSVQQPSEVNAWQLIQVNVGASARYVFHGYAFGGAPHRKEIHVRLLGPGAEAELKGALVCAGRQKLDLQLNLEHIAPGCRSRQQFHGIALDRSELTFNGRIHIHPDAQKSDARLSNRNLLGHDSARINTKPELEIYADDVQCSHGATVGQMSEAELFYLRSRGIELSQARAMLLRAFIAAVLPESRTIAGIEGLYEEVLRQWA
jgi:Fe-S cluster assembly protein SufD